MALIRLVSNVTTVAASFLASGPRTAREVSQVTRHHGRLLQTRVRAHASGRPGPRAPTGDYRRGIGYEFNGGAASAQAVVGSNHPQGRRLELGFTGTDSLGRYYDQPPYPHFGPAVDDIEQDYVEALSDAAVRWFT